MVRKDHPRKSVEKSRKFNGRVALACGVFNTGRESAAAVRMVAMPTSRKIFASVFCLACWLLAGANSAAQQDEKKQEKSKDQSELIARCKTQIIKRNLQPQPKNWQIGKDEAFRSSPQVSYTIQEDGTVSNLKLKRGSGVRGIDEYALNIVKGRKYQPMPGCPGVDATETVTIDFQSKN
jgi:TonB family protein